MSPSTAIPVAPGTTPAPAAGDALPADGDATACRAPRTGLNELVAARLAARATASQVATAAAPHFTPGKPVPGPAAWRALERHAASFRLR